MKIGDKVMIRDAYITADWQIPQGEILEIAYEKNSEIPMVYLIGFELGKSEWFHKFGLKVQ